MILLLVAGAGNLVVVSYWWVWRMGACAKNSAAGVYWIPTWYVLSHRGAEQDIRAAELALNRISARQGLSVLGSCAAATAVQISREDERYRDIEIYRCVEM